MRLKIGCIYPILNYNRKIRDFICFILSETYITRNFDCAKTPENETEHKKGIVIKMNINTKNLVSITEANQNFSLVARLVDENGAVVILKNNVPRYVLVEFSQVEQEQLAENEDIEAVSKRLIEKNRIAYEELAK